MARDGRTGCCVRSNHPASLIDCPRNRSIADPRAELFRALAVLAETPDNAHAVIRTALGFSEAPATAEHTALFVFNLYPYASVYLNADGMLGGDARDRIAGFWRALALVPPSEPDHLVALFGLYANLCEREANADPGPQQLLVAHARQTLLDEHIVPWAFAYLEKVRDFGSPFYAVWATLARNALLAELDGADQRDVPAAVRDIPLLDGNDADLDTFLNALLAFARSGVLITRRDLRRCGAALGLAVRHGERRYILRALFAQDVRATLAWLREESDSWARRHEALTGPPTSVRALAARRARCAAEVLGIATKRFA